MNVFVVKKQNKSYILIKKISMFLSEEGGIDERGRDRKGQIELSIPGSCFFNSGSKQNCTKQGEKFEKEYTFHLELRIRLGKRKKLEMRRVTFFFFCFPSEFKYLESSIIKMIEN